jgi:hypothetical protein
MDNSNAPVEITNSDGIVVVFPTEGEILTNGNNEQETIVYDRNDNGDVIGWHKEKVGK